jgi:TadE-like protein
MPPRNNRSGNAMIEFTLVGIPLIFVLLITFETARGMWLYATVAHAVRVGARYAAVHGRDCATPPHDCAVTVAHVAGVIRDAGVGLDPADFRLAMIATGPNTLPTVTLTPLNTLLTNTSVFPSGTGSVAGNDVIVTGVFYFRTALTALFPPPITPPPPPTPLGGGSDAGVIRLAATSRERIEF